MRQFTIVITLAISTLAIALLSACGTPYATVVNRAGEPVMLLGYDPVAYFTKGEPARGSAQFKTKLPDRTYYFASLENQALFAANPAKYEPQYGGFCASGAAFAIKLGSDPTAWQIHNGRLFIFGDVLGKTGVAARPRLECEPRRQTVARYCQQRLASSFTHQLRLQSATLQNRHPNPNRIRSQKPRQTVADV
jgi:YHS domain-containing protein